MRKKDNKPFVSNRGGILVYDAQCMCFHIIFEKNGRRAQKTVFEEQFYKMGRTALFAIVDALKQEVDK